MISCACTKHAVKDNFSYTRDLFKGLFLKSKYIDILLSAIFRGCKTQEENNKEIIKKKNKFLEYLNNKVNKFFWYINRFFNILSL